MKPPFALAQTRALAFASALGSILPSLALCAWSQTSVVDDCQYPDAQAARTAWKPMAGTSPVSVTRVNQGWALQLPCTFAGTSIERASWDRTVQLDLAACGGVQFDFCCSNSAPVSSFSLYFQSGAGWYHASFAPTAAGWHAITINKADTTIEGQPAGWSKIQTIRLSAWRGQDADTEFFISRIRKTGLLGHDSRVVIVRGESAAQRWPEEGRGINQYAETVAEYFQAAHVGCTVLSDLDVDPARLEAALLVVLPYNPQLPERTLDALTGYVRGGGKLLVFYSIPDTMLPLLHLTRGPHIKASPPGQFSTIRFLEKVDPAAPPTVTQHSWNIQAVRPIPGQATVWAEWLDDQGQPTGHAAVVGSSNAVFMTHVLLSDDPARKQRMLLAMAGALVPELWSQAAHNSITASGHFGPFQDFEQAATQIAALHPNNATVRQTIASARGARDSAQAAAAQSRFAEALDQAAVADQKIKESFCLAQTPLPGEFRAFWCHDALGVSGLSWTQAIRGLAENGFTAILPNMLWGGAAFYPSSVLPVAASASERGDQVAACLAACRQYGLQVHVWKVNWYLGHAAPAPFIERMRREGRLQAASNGQETLWLCPSHRNNQQLEIDSMVEVARNYAVDGLHFDYIRYPDADHCCCSGCRERFGRAVQVEMRDWPKEVLPGGRWRPEWLEWRRENITTVVRAVSDQARGVRPTIKLSAAVFRNWNADRDQVGQDWKAWCERGYLDFVCPMDYTPNNGLFESMVARQVNWAGRTPCYPGIGVSASASRFDAVRAIEQILITRRHNTRGFVIFNYGPREAQELLPMLGLGITARAPLNSGPN